MLLHQVMITYVSPCLADPGKIRLKAKLSDDITGIMPYLNAVVKNATYNPNGPTFTLHREYRLITLYPRDMTMIKAQNTTDAQQVIAWLQDLINRTYARREEIEPIYETRQRPHPLQLYSWLPRTNCRQCGEYTCLAFAALLFCGQQRLDRCVTLNTPEYREQRQVLLELATALGYTEEA